MNIQEIMRESEAVSVNKCREQEADASVRFVRHYRGSYLCPECYSYNAEWKRRENTKHFDIVYCWHCGYRVQLN